MAKINETLKQLRLDRGMTQEQVAEQVGLTRQAVSGYESGRTQPGVDILQRLAGVYDVELTDIIYGRSQSIRMYNATKITAVVMACVFLAVQLAGSILLWIANSFYHLGQVSGSLDEAGKMILVTRSKLMDAWSILEGFYYGLLPLCCVALLVLTLCLRRPLAAKTKLLCVLSYAAASMVVVLPWALSDPIYPPINYLITPTLCLVHLAVFLLLSLIIDFFRTRKLKADAENTVEPEEPNDTAHGSVFKRWWFWVLIGAAVLLLLSLLVVALFGGTAEVTPVENPAFSLNGEDYPQSPTMQDFLDRGWKQGDSVEQTGKFSEEDGVSELIYTGYRLNYGENHISAYLVEDDVRSELKTGQCRLRSLSLYGENVTSFALNGKELANVNRENIVEILGEPDRVKNETLGAFYYYSMQERGISEIQFTFPNTLDTVGQILIVFDV